MHIPPLLFVFLLERRDNDLSTDMIHFLYQLVVLLEILLSLLNSRVVVHEILVKLLNLVIEFRGVLLLLTHSILGILRPIVVGLIQVLLLYGLLVWLHLLLLVILVLLHEHSRLVHLRRGLHDRRWLLSVHLMLLLLLLVLIECHHVASWVHVVHLLLRRGILRIVLVLLLHLHVVLSLLSGHQSFSNPWRQVQLVVSYHIQLLLILVLWHHVISIHLVWHYKS